MPTISQALKKCAECGQLGSRLHAGRSFNIRMTSGQHPERRRLVAIRRLASA